MYFLYSGLIISKWFSGRNNAVKRCKSLLIKTFDVIFRYIYLKTGFFARQCAPKEMNYRTWPIVILT